VVTGHSPPYISPGQCPPDNLTFGQKPPRTKAPDIWGIPWFPWLFKCGIICLQLYIVLTVLTLSAAAPQNSLLPASLFILKTPAPCGSDSAFCWHCVHLRLQNSLTYINLHLQITLTYLSTYYTLLCKEVCILRVLSNECYLSVFNRRVDAAQWARRVSVRRCWTVRTAVDRALTRTRRRPPQLRRRHRLSPSLAPAPRPAASAGAAAAAARGPYRS